MDIIKHDQAREINYFSLEEFVHNIKLYPNVLEHMEDVNMQFDEYLNKLKLCKDEEITYYLISYAYEELKCNQQIENCKLDNFDFNRKNLFFDNLNVNHTRINNIHKYVMKDDKSAKNVGKYRTGEARVSAIYPKRNIEEIFWYGAQVKDIKPFMDDFLKIYKENNPSVLNSNPFLKSSLVHLLLLKIHPYSDGNGRTSRIIHNIKCTEILNKLYGMNLKISPINLSQSIEINKARYVQIIDSIYFDNDHENNKMLNYWFDFMLNMYDEQLYHNQHLIEHIDELMEKAMHLKERFGDNFTNICLTKKR